MHNQPHQPLSELEALRGKNAVMTEQIAMVRGLIVGGLAGGHMEGEYGAEYGKNLVLQIADMLGILDTIPQNIIDGTFRQNLPALTIVPSTQDDLFLEPDPTLD